jgi:hypothetical protein
MKKLYILVLSFIFVIGITFLPGCGGGGNNNPLGGNDNPAGNDSGAHIAVYQTSGSGGVALIMPKLIINNIAYADNLQIGANQTYILYLGGGFPTLQVFVEDDNGQRKTDVINVAPDYTSAGFSQCISIQGQTNMVGGGVQFNINQVAPGKCKIVLTGGSLTREVDILIWDTQQNLYTSGILINDTGHQQAVSAGVSDIYEQTGSYCINGDWYKVDTCDLSDWMAKFKAVQTVNSASFTTGPHAMTIGEIYVSRAKNGGFIKSVRLMGIDAVFEWCDSSGQFRDI